MASNKTDFRQLLSDIKFYSDYGQFDYERNVYEAWPESVDRVMDMHKIKYKDKLNDKLLALMNEAEEAYKSKLVLGSQRALQFGGESLLKHEAKMYNCLSSHVDRARFFQDYFYFLLCGCGVGFSVQDRHISKLPAVKKRSKRTRTYTVEDSIEGWADSVGVLLSSYFVDGGTYPEYKNYTIHFDLSNIREKGSFISGGFKAPGPEPLRESLILIEKIVEGALKRNDKGEKLKSIEIYDICMLIADAVISGGVRRSATICLFDRWDTDMMNAKTFSNYSPDPNNSLNPQRARSNNSAVLKRGDVTFEEFMILFNKVKDYGEPGFIFVDHYDATFNPCVEIQKFPLTIDGRSGFQGCNLTELNGGKCTTVDIFYKACRAGAILGTLQAGYTDFRYVEDTCKEIFDREALLGVSITGMAMNPSILFDPEVQRKGAEIVKEVNKEVAELIGINQAARTTCVKPSGNASVILKTSSGIHSEHAKDYFRLMQMNKDNDVVQFVKETNPHMIEESVWSRDKTDYVIYVPIENPEGTLYKDEVNGVDFLELVKLTQENWVEYGTNIDLCVKPELRHNVSNTCTVPEGDWDDVAEFIFENKDTFSGVSLLGSFGDKDYQQAPNTSVITDVNKLYDTYGVGVTFSSGLIVDGLKVFNDNLWTATQAVKDFNKNSVSFKDKDILKIDWIRRANKFAKNFFEGDLDAMILCLKNVHLLHKWHTIKNKYTPIDWSSYDSIPEFTDVDTMGAVACHGGSCEII
jgi:ribonucleoside-diphosphate reductase alpha chain